MYIRRSLVAAALLALTGCPALPRREPGPRADPLTMSHLTHRREDPLYVDTEGEWRRDDPAGPPGKQVSTAQMAPRGAGYVDAAPGGSETGGTLRGTLGFGRDGWQLSHLPPGADRRRDIRLVLGTRGGLFRDGDRVQVTGRLVAGAGGEAFHVDSIGLDE